MNDRKYFYTTLFSYQSNTTNTTLLSCFISLSICSNGSRKGQYVLYEYEEDVGSQHLSPSHKNVCIHRRPNVNMCAHK